MTYWVQQKNQNCNYIRGTKKIKTGNYQENNKKVREAKYLAIKFFKRGRVVKKGH